MTVWQPCDFFFSTSFFSPCPPCPPVARPFTRAQSSSPSAVPKKKGEKRKERCSQHTTSAPASRSVSSVICLLWLARKGRKLKAVKQSAGPAVSRCIIGFVSFSLSSPRLSVRPPRALDAPRREIFLQPFFLSSKMLLFLLLRSKSTRALQGVLVA